MTRRRNTSKPVIRESFTLYTPESIEAGDAAEHGWIDEEGVDMTPDEYDVEEGVTAVDKAVKHLRSEGASEPSSSSFHPGIGYASMHDADMRTGEQEEHHFHLHGFSPEEEHSIFQQMTARRRFNPRPRRHNPPLPEHMAHDDLDEIARGLALRFVAKPKGRRMIYFLRSLLKEVNRQAVARGSDTIPGDTGFRPVAQRELGSLHAEADMILDFIRQELE